jgi:hypothetical protein
MSEPKTTRRLNHWKGVFSQEASRPKGLHLSELATLIQVEMILSMIGLRLVMGGMIRTVTARTVVQKLSSLSPVPMSGLQMNGAAGL